MKWVPVSERLPEKDVKVLCIDDVGIIGVIHWGGKYWKDGTCGCCPIMWGEPTHWMEIPDKPEESK